MSVNPKLTTFKPDNSWEHFPHDADIGVRGYGRNVATAFENAARAMTAVMLDPAGVRPKQVVHITCKAPDQEILLVDWLNALIFEMSTRKMIFSEFNVSLENGRLEAEARGETIDVERHAPAVEIKGATFTELKLAQIEDGRWLAQCVIDV